MDEIVSAFQRLSADQIRAQPVGKWSDSDLLDVLHHFTEKDDAQRAAAVRTLVLHSPEHNEMVAYDELYFDQMEAARRAGRFAEALRWAYAALAYGEQHDPGLDRMNRYRDIGEMYLYAGDADTGLALFTRLLETDPTDVWTYNILALTLPHVGLSDLAVEVLDRGLQLLRGDDEERLRSQFERLRREAAERAGTSPGRLSDLDPDGLQRFRTALQRTDGHPEGEDAYLPPLDRLIPPEGSDIDALYAHILSQGKVLAADLIRMAFDESLLDTPGPDHAVALLRRLHADGLVELGELARWLSQAEGDWRRELLTQTMGKIGGYTTDELEQWAGDTDVDLFVRSNASKALVERAQKCPEQRGEIVRFMRRLLTRPEAHERAEEETFIGFLIGDITDWGATELYPEIEAAFREDRVDPTITDLDFVQSKFGMTRSPAPRDGTMASR